MRKLSLLILISLSLLLALPALAQQDETPAPQPASQTSSSPGYLGLDIFERAGRAFQAEDYQQAVTDYSLFILLNPTDSESYYRRALVYLQLDQTDSALADLNQALDLPSPTPELTARLYDLRAVIYIERDQIETAISDLNAGLKAAPESPLLYLRRGRLLAFQEQYDQALADFDQLIELQPDLPDGYILRALVLTQLERYDEAISDYNHLIELQPDDPLAYSSRAQVYLQQENYQAALTDLNDAIRLEPRSAELYLLRGSAHAHLGHQTETAQDYLDWSRGQRTDLNTDLVLRPGESQTIQLEAGLIYVLGFRGKAGQQVTITAVARADQDTDPLIILVDSQASPLIADDNSGGKFDARIQDFILPVDGEYGVIVSQAAGRGDGSLRVLLQVSP